MKNITELKNQFPLAFDLFERFVEKHWETRLALFLDKVKKEDVVEFLDEQRVHLNIHSGQVSESKAFFCCGIAYEYDYFSFPRIFISRNEATEEGIKKAFELLENNLKTN